MVQDFIITLATGTGKVKELVMNDNDKLKEMIKHLENAEAQFKLAIEAAYKDGFDDGHCDLSEVLNKQECWEQSDSKATLDGCE